MSIPEWQTEQLQQLLVRLAKWRNEDQEDEIVLHRSEIIAILEGFHFFQGSPK